MKNFRPHAKRVFPILILLLMAVSACNFPLNDLGAITRRYPTLDPAIFETRKTAVAGGGGVSATELAPLITDQSILYSVQSGDTLAAVASHFSVMQGQITSPDEIASPGLLRYGQSLLIPRTTTNTQFGALILPDSAVIDSPCAQDFNLPGFVNLAGGYLNYYSVKAGTETLTGPHVVQRVAQNTSVNPRLLLALVEFRSGWLYQYTSTPNNLHPLDMRTANFEGLYLELSLAARHINTGYYAWRKGQLTSLTYTDGLSAPIPPNLNAGSVGLLYLFAQIFPQASAEAALYGPGGFTSLYENMFGDRFECAALVEPLFPDGLQEPTLELPFAAGEIWSFTGGLHPNWNAGTPYGALDFAPITDEPVCAVSATWVRASAAGLVTRSLNSVVIIALEDASGQPTGWELMYMHVAAKDRVEVGTHMKVDDLIGHPSCEGGTATGSHVHITRKYRGEWIGAGEPFPLVLSGWLALPGSTDFNSALTRDGITISPRSDGLGGAEISR